MSSTGTITTGKLTLAVGLYWQTINSANASSNAKSYVRNLSGQDDGQQDAVEFYCVRPSIRDSRESAQVGVAREGRGYKTGMVAGAAVLVSALPPQNWVGCWETRQGWWVVFAREDILSPYGDVLYRHEDEAKEAVDAQRKKGDIEKTYAPDSWGFANSDGTALHVLMADAKKTVTLKKANGAYVRPIAIGAGLVALAAVAVTLGDQLFPGTSSQPTAKLDAGPVLRKKVQPDAVVAPPAAPAPETPPPPPRLWENAAKPSNLLSACHVRIAAIPLGVSGWKLNKITCNAAGVDVTWSRIDDEAGVVMSSWSVDATVKTASEHIALDGLQARGGEQLWSRNAVTTYFVGWPVRVALAPVPDQPPPAAGANGGQPPPPPPPPPWFKRTINFTTGISPWNLASGLDAVPGLVINQVSHSDGQEWAVEGVIYEVRDAK